MTKTLNNSYRYDKFMYQIHQAILSFESEERTLSGEERRRLLLLDELVKQILQSNTINYDNIYLMMKMYCKDNRIK